VSDALNLILAQDFILDNGFKVITAQDNSNPVICLQLYIRTGSVNESNQTSGYSHFIEHLTFKNTDKYPRNLISEIVPFLGGVINAYTELDTTCYYIILPAEEIYEGLQIISELAYKSDFDEDDVKIEKDIIIEEIKQYANEPEAVFIDNIQTTYFKHSPLKNPILGTVRSIKSASLDSLKSFYREKYVPENVFLVISGCFDYEKVVVHVQELFSDWSKSTSHINTIIPISDPEINGFRFSQKICKKNGEYLAFVLPELSEKEELNIVQLIVTKAFASGKQSRLHKRIVEKDKTSLEIKLHSISGLLNGITIVQVVPISPEVVPDIIYAFYDEWVKMRQEFIQINDIELICKELNYAWLYDFEYIESLAGVLANEEIISSYIDLYDFPNKIASVQADQFHRCMKLYWRTEYLSVYYQGKNILPVSIIRNVQKLFCSPLPAVNVRMIDESDQAKKHFSGLTQTIKTGRLIKQPEFKQIKLDCGMNLVMRQVINKPTIGVALTSTLSQLSELPAEKGINFLTSGLLLFGTYEKTYDDIQKECLNHGFSIKTSQTLESTTLKGKCLSASLEPMIRLLAEISQQPSFPQHFLTYIKSTITDSLRREKNFPFSFAYNNWINLLLGKENNLNKPYGNIGSVRRSKLSQIHDWYERYYDFKNFHLCLSGDIDYSKVEDLCNRYFNSSQRKNGLPEHNYFYTNQDHLHIIKDVASDQSNIFVGGMGTPSTDIASNSAFYVLSQVIGGDLSSRFFTILREKYGYAYQAGFDTTSLQKLGYWFGFVTCDKSDYLPAYKLMNEIIADIRKNGITDNELISAKNYMKGMQRLDMESVSWQATTLSILYALGYDYNHFMNRENRIASVKHDLIRDVAEKYFAADNLYTYIER
jgi:zinc protease